MTQLHLVGGFLGSGKTTAIAEAARQLLARGIRVGVVTNDQGKYLVDTAFFALQDVPAVEVSGGCFCCGYDDFVERLSELRASAQPQVIFAESVGSCADIVATVVKPLLELRSIDLPPSSLSVFADARLLLRRLQGQPLPFSDDVVYVFDQQLAEAGLVVANKIDLLASEQHATLAGLMATDSVLADKRTRLQDSTSPESVATWLRTIESEGLALAAAPLDIDYSRYGAGEVRLAWLDQIVDITVAQGPVRQAVDEALSRIITALRKATPAIAHLKFVISGIDGEAKISVTSADTGDSWRTGLPPLVGNTARLLINARVELPAETVERVIAASFAGVEADIRVVMSNAFHPAMPSPTLRL